MDERKTMAAIMDEVKNKLDYKVGHYVHQKDLTFQQNHNILRYFMFIKLKFFPDGTMDKLKARVVADGSLLSPLQVVYLLFNIASYYKCM